MIRRAQGHAQGHSQGQPKQQMVEPLQLSAKPSSSASATATDIDDDDDDTEDETEPSIAPLLHLASAHCTSQAVHAAVRLRIPDILGEAEDKSKNDQGNNDASSDRSSRLLAKAMTIDELSKKIGSTTHTAALLRILRLLTAADILVQVEKEVDDSAGSAAGHAVPAFCLTKTGRLLRTTTTTKKKKKSENNPPSNNNTGMASCILHLMARPLWDAWFEVPGYVQDGPSSPPPFDRANGGVSSDAYYNQRDNPESLRHANDFVRIIYEQELRAVVQGFDWARLADAVMHVVDVGGHHGQLIRAIRRNHPGIDGYCLDLPEVIANAPLPFTSPSASLPTNAGLNDNNDNAVKLVGGNALDPLTIPDCDVILMKHFLDRCMWNEEETVKVLQSCRAALLRSVRANDGPNNDDQGTVIVADAVLPNVGGGGANNNKAALQMDAMYMLVGREGQRTEYEWERLALAAGFRMERTVPTPVPTCHLIIMKVVP